MGCNNPLGRRFWDIRRTREQKPVAATCFDAHQFFSFLQIRNKRRYPTTVGHACKSLNVGLEAIRIPSDDCKDSIEQDPVAEVLLDLCTPRLKLRIRTYDFLHPVETFVVADQREHCATLLQRWNRCDVE